MRFRLILIAFAALWVGVSHATEQRTRFEGTIRLVMGGRLIITTGKGDVIVALTPATRVLMHDGRDVSVADLKPGVLVGADTTQAADGKVAAAFITIENATNK